MKHEPRVLAENLLEAAQPDQIENFLDDMFELYLRENSLTEESLEDKHFIKRLIVKIVRQLETL